MIQFLISKCRFPMVMIFLAWLTTLSSYGCGSSGTWDDDPKNWRRAFKSQKPEYVEVLHSRYWRSPHWTYEFQYFFQIRKNDELKEQLFSENKLERIEDAIAESAASEFFCEKPDWFVPKHVDQYEIYIFIDKDTGDIFLTDFQV